MANKVELTVESCTASENGGFILKLQNKDEKSEKTAFGTIIQKSQQTYYMKTDAKQKVGFSAALDLDLFKITELPYSLPEDADEPGKVIQLKWLFL